MIKAVIFDLNGIFIHSEKFSDRFERDFSIPSEVFLPKLLEIMHKVRQPNAGPAFKYWEPVLEEWKVYLSEQEFWDYWFKNEVVSEKMVDIAKELRAENIKVFILSNNFKERADYYGHYEWIKNSVDKVYFSFQSGFVKPDKRAWTELLLENHIDAKECLYFDDQEKNTKIAELIGIKSFIFSTEENVKEIIRKEAGLSLT